MLKNRSLLYSIIMLVFALAILGSARADLTEDLVFLMTFDDGKGDTFKDLSEFGNDGVGEGKMDWIDGKFSGGFHFDGATHIAVENAAPLQDLTHPMSVGAWVSPEALGDWHNIAEMDGPAGWKMGFHASTAIVWTTYFVKDFVSQTPIELDTWTHVVATWDGTEAIVYVNGEPDAPIAGGGVIDVSGEPSLDIGWRRSSGSAFFTGGMDELFIYSRVLEQDEIKDIMNGFGDVLAVEPEGKLASTWGALKL